VADQSAETDIQRPSLRVAQVLRERIELGVAGYRVGDALPPYRQLGDEHGVATNTAMAAVKVLRDSGWVTGKPNGRNYVRDQTSQMDPAEQLTALRAEINELRTLLQQAGDSLGEIDGRLAEALSRLAALEE
jgi:DNA-binding FadR family transcriptional regulator